MRVTIGIICLNEEEYLGKNLEQHYPLADQIIVVEGADSLYPKERVTSGGLSTDKTAEIVRSFPDPDSKIIFIQHGWTRDNGAQAKCELRNRYLELTKPGLLAAIDADEFYRRDDFRQIVDTAERHEEYPYEYWQYPTLHFWRNTEQFITGGYYDIPHTRFWRIVGGEQYRRDHNTPERRGRPLINGYIADLVVTNKGRLNSPICYHFGFTKRAENMRDKTDYYQARGEGKSRKQTTASRAAWFDSDERLESLGLKLWPYGGLLPECFTRIHSDTVQQSP